MERLPVGAAGERERVRAGEALEEEGVLRDVDLEGGQGQRPVADPLHERVRTRCRRLVSAALPQASGEVHRTARVCAGASGPSSAICQNAASWSSTCTTSASSGGPACSDRACSAAT